VANERELRVAMRKDLAPRVFLEQWLRDVVVEARKVMLKIGPELRNRLADYADGVVSRLWMRRYDRHWVWYMWRPRRRYDAACLP
jgi:hypothetical protein